MMMDATGDIFNVKGRRREIAATGPRPGRTPTTVPRIDPMKQARRFMG